MVGRVHPPLWIFIRKMKDEQRLVESSAMAARRGDAPRPRRRKWVEMERRIQRLKAQYNAGIRDLDAYWNAIVYVVRKFV